jgi:hypothetical protein
MICCNPNVGCTEITENTESKSLQPSRKFEPLPLFVCTLIESTQPLSAIYVSDYGSYSFYERLLLGAWMCRNTECVAFLTKCVAVWPYVSPTRFGECCYSYTYTEYWGRAKYRHCKVNKNMFKDTKDAAESALNTCPVEVIRRFVNRSWRWMSAYRMGQGLPWCIWILLNSS